MDVAGGELDRLHLLWRQLTARFGRKRPHRHEPGRLAVEPHGLCGKRIPAAHSHILDDRANRRLQGGIASLLRTGERGAAVGRVEVLPDEAPHIIIFSIGRTRIADAPTDFSFWSVSQKTDSWQTAWTAKCPGRP